VGNLRPAILYLAALLVLLSIPPIRRRLPGLRSCPAGVELLLWAGFVWLCLAALARVQTIRSADLGLATARVAIYFSGQALESLLGSTSRWVSAHEPDVVVVTLGVVGFSWVVIAARSVAAFRRAREPRPRLGDWWVLRLRAAPRAQVGDAPSAQVAALMDAGAAALYLGVTSATVYRWARTGRLRSRRARGRLRFSTIDLAAVREIDSPPQNVASTNIAR